MHVMCSQCAHTISIDNQIEVKVTRDSSSLSQRSSLDYLRWRYPRHSLQIFLQE